MRRPTADRLKKAMWWDKAWSLVSGCVPVSDGCANCWAAEQADTRGYQESKTMQHRYGGLTLRTGNGVPYFNGEIRFMYKDLLKPFSQLTGRVFSIWTDLWHGTPEQIALAFATMMATQRHDYVICTKIPERMLAFFEAYTPMDCWRYAGEYHGPKFQRACGRFTVDQVPATWPLPNVIGMVTVESQEHVLKRLPHLIVTPFATRAIACEPLLGPVDFSQYGNAIDWVTAGCEVTRKSWLKRRADRDWFRHIAWQCDAFSIPLFLKQMEYCSRVAKLPPLDDVVYDQFPE